jgi:hypothetical protein
MKVAPEEVDQFNTALDRMVQAGWVHIYKFDSKTNEFSVNYSGSGQRKLKLLLSSFDEIASGTIGKDLWWTVLTIANRDFGNE